jgi:hypothetical protein
MPPHRDDGGLIDHDALAAGEHDGVRGPEVNGEIS